MNTSVDPIKVEALADKIKRLSQIIEINETGINNEISRLIQTINANYSETSVRQKTFEIDAIIKEVRMLSQSTITRFNGIVKVLKNAANTYREEEEKYKKLAQNIKAKTYTVNKIALLRNYVSQKTVVPKSYTLKNPVVTKSDNTISKKSYALREGSNKLDTAKSQEIMEFQKLLERLGFLNTRGIYGYFGTVTLAAVNKFKDKYLPDGNKGANWGVVEETTLSELKKQVVKLDESKAEVASEISTVKNVYIPNSTLSIGEKGIDDIVNKIFMGNKNANPKMKENLYVQYYLRILDNYADFQKGNSDEYDIGNSGPFENGVDGAIGMSTLKALYNFQKSHPEVEQTIVKVAHNKYSGTYGNSTIEALKKEVLFIDEKWKIEFKNVQSKLDKSKYLTANPYFYTQFVLENGDSSTMDEIDPVFRARLAALARDNKQYFRFGEGLRDYDRQKYFWDKYIAGTGSLAAFPGFGRHNWGMAADTKSTWLQNLEYTLSTANQKTLEIYGLFKPLTKGNGTAEKDRENWHIQPIETNGVQIPDLNSWYYAYRYKPLPSNVQNKITAVVNKVNGIEKNKRETCGMEIEPDILLIQSCLRVLKYDLGKSGIDGVCGIMNETTEKALIKFKKENGFGSTATYDELVIMKLIECAEKK